MLTDLTGRNANAERSQVTAGMQIKRSTFVAVMWGLLPGLLLTGALILFFDPIIALIAGMVIGVGATMFFLSDDSGDNVSAKRYKRLLHKVKGGKSEFTLCWAPLDISGSQFFLVSRTAAAVKDSDR
jgi:Flp pilus assembly protein TadB